MRKIIIFAYKERESDTTNLVKLLHYYLKRSHLHLIQFHNINLIK